MMWLYLSLELVYIGLLLISCTLLAAQLCIRAWFPSTQRWGQLLNAFAAVFTVLGGAPLDIPVCGTGASWIPSSQTGRTGPGRKISACGLSDNSDTEMNSRPPPPSFEGRGN